MGLPSALMNTLPATAFGDLATRQELRNATLIIREDLVGLESRLTARLVGGLLASQAVTVSFVALVALR